MTFKIWPSKWFDLPVDLWPSASSHKSNFKLVSKTTDCHVKNDLLYSLSLTSARLSIVFFSSMGRLHTTSVRLSSSGKYNVFQCPVELLGGHKPKRWHAAHHRAVWRSVRHQLWVHRWWKKTDMGDAAIHQPKCWWHREPEGTFSSTFGRSKYDVWGYSWVLLTTRRGDEVNNICARYLLARWYLLMMSSSVVPL